MKKLIFLDIDGVLNSHDWYERREKLAPDCTREEFRKNEFDPYAVQRLQRILAETNAEVVLSSTWRLYKKDHTYIREIVCDFIDITPECTSRIRGSEIYMWMKENIPYNEPVKYAILDDDSDMLMWQQDSFFQTSFMSGLTDEITEQVIEHLNS